MKFLIIGTTALAIASTSVLYAAQSSSFYAQLPSTTDEEQLWQRGAEDLHDFDEARLATLKTRLMLTPEQERNWLAFEQAARDFAKQRIDRRIAMHGAPPANDPIEHMRRRATAMVETGAALRTLADATQPLYERLDDNQKRLFRSMQSPDGHRQGSFSRP